MWRENVLGCLFVDIICSEKRKVFRERKRDEDFEEQIISKANIRAFFSPHEGYCVY